MKYWNNFEIISVFYFTCDRRRWLHMKYNTEIISKLFQNNFISHITTVLARLRESFQATSISCKYAEAAELGALGAPALPIWPVHQ